MNDLSDFINELSHLIKHNDATLEIIKEICKKLSQRLNASVTLTDSEMRVFAEISSDIIVERNVIEKLKTSGYNISLKSFGLENTYACVISIIAHRERLAAAYIFTENEISEENKTVLKTAELILGILLSRLTVQQSYSRKSQHHAVKNSLAAMSYREIEASVAIFKELGASEGIIIASSVSKQTGITRSAIVNALRKLESGSLVECRSLGVKGTHIKIKNPGLIDELKKYDKIR